MKINLDNIIRKLGFLIAYGDVMKKISIVIFAFLLTIAMTACGKSHNSYSKESLFDLGIEVTKTMQEMVYSEEYISLYSAVEFKDEIVKFQAKDYDSPIAVYSVEIPNTKDVLSKLGSENIDDYDKLSDNLKEQLDHRVSFGAIISSINAQSGAKTMAMCSLLTAAKYDKDMELDKSIAYLYVFEKGTPIVVTFTRSGYANGQFLLLSDSKSYEDISEIFSNYSCKIDKIK